MTEREVVEAARAAGLEAPVHFHAVIGSTNTEALRLAETGEPAWTLVAADRQEAGRGRLGRTWVSPPGGSLVLSIVLRPQIPAAEAPLISLAAGAALARACYGAGGVDARCKWPNDVVVGERKLAGVLAEAKVVEGRLLHIVVGTGVNVGQRSEDFPPEVRGGATSVAIEGGRPDVPGLLAAYLLELRRLLQAGDMRATIVKAYRAGCSTIGLTVRAVTTSGRQVVGLAVGVGENGELLIDTADGTTRVGFGEIEHLR